MTKGMHSVCVLAFKALHRDHDLPGTEGGRTKAISVHEILSSSTKAVHIDDKAVYVVHDAVHFLKGRRMNHLIRNGAGCLRRACTNRKRKACHSSRVQGVLRTFSSVTCSHLEIVVFRVEFHASRMTEAASRRAYDRIYKHA